jgi:hypothetical protein
LCGAGCLRYNRGMDFGISFLAGTTAVVCLVLLVRLGLGPARQQRFDRTARRLGWRLRAAAQALWASLSRVAVWCRGAVQGPVARRNAKREADAAIERARTGRNAQGGDWSGNVYTPKSFRKPTASKPPDTAPPQPPVPPHKLH